MDSPELVAYRTPLEPVARRPDLAASRVPMWQRSDALLAFRKPSCVLWWPLLVALPRCRSWSRAAKAVIGTRILAVVSTYRRPARWALRQGTVLALWLAASCAATPDEGPQEEPEISTLVPLDELVVAGQTLRGRIVTLGRNGVGIETVYGQGELTVPYDTIEHVYSPESFRLLLEEETEDRVVRGRLLNVDAQHVTIGYDLRSAQRIPTASIVSGLRAAEYDDSFWTRLHETLRYWRASFDAGWDLERGAVEKVKVNVGAHVERRRKPTRLAIDFRYAFETQEKTDSPKTTTKDEARGFVFGSHDVTPDFFLYAWPAAEMDQPRQIDLRAYPAAGAGYRFLESDDGFLESVLGLGYVYEDFDVGQNDYFAGQVGLSGEYDFGEGIVLTGTITYMPGIPTVDENWLFRMELDLKVPLYGPLAFRFGFTEVNDNNPTPDTGNNKTTTILGLSLQF